MSEIDAKVNMSLDDIIKMEKKDKKKKAVASKGKGGVVGTKGGAKRNRNVNGARSVNQRGGGGIRARGGVVKTPNVNAPAQKKRRLQQQPQNVARPGFVTKRFNNKKKNNAKKNNAPVAGSLVRSRSNTALNRLKNNNNNNNNNNVNARGAFATRRANAAKFALTRSKSRTNLIPPTMKRFFNNNKGVLKRTNSLPNLRADPTSVHNRLGYQSPAQVAYRNRVKRAKQVLLQRQNQRMQIPNDYRVPHNGKALTALQQRALIERRQQILVPQRNFNNVGLRSDQILRAQRRAQYAQKLMRMNALRMAPNPNVNFMCTLGDDYAPAAMRQRSLSRPQPQNRGAMNNARQLARARSPSRPNNRHLAALGQPPMFVVQAGASVDDRTFSEMMYSLTGNLGVTERTLNDRFSY